MPEDITLLIHKLAERHSLSVDEYESLIVNRSEDSTRLLRSLAVIDCVNAYGDILRSKTSYERYGGIVHYA